MNKEYKLQAHSSQELQLISIDKRKKTMDINIA